MEPALLRRVLCSRCDLSRTESLWRAFFLPPQEAATISAAVDPSASSSSRSGPEGPSPSSSSSPPQGSFAAFLVPVAGVLNCTLPFNGTLDLAALSGALGKAEAAKAKGNESFKSGKMPEARRSYGAPSRGVRCS